jgi:hypothetical protein
LVEIEKFQKVTPSTFCNQHQKTKVILMKGLKKECVFGKDEMQKESKKERLTKDVRYQE